MISPFSLLKSLLFILSLSLYQVISGLGKPTDSQEKDTLLPSFAVKLDGGFLVILGTSKWINDQQNVVRKTERAYLPSIFNTFAALLHWIPLKNQCGKLWFHGLITFKIRFTGKRYNSSLPQNFWKLSIYPRLCRKIFVFLRAVYHLFRPPQLCL